MASAARSPLTHATQLGRPLLVALALVACGSGPSAERAAPSKPRKAPPSTSELPGNVDPPGFCARPAEDAVRDVFCGEKAARVTGLAELEDTLSVGFGVSGGVALSSGYDESAYSVLDFRVVALGHSTALSGALVSPINPRVIVIGPNTLMAFNRGVQQAELATTDRGTYRLNFYLVSFEQACNASPAGCSPGALYTPAIESDWVTVSVQDAEELKNSPSDCRQCHQRGLEAPTLLMRELDGPWTHFFQPPDNSNGGIPEPSGADLAQDYFDAKGDETYGGVPSASMGKTIGLALEGVVNLPQPLVFNGIQIQGERWPFGPAGYASEPVKSATWYDAYERFKRGELLPLPYFDPRPTDATKQAALTDAYQRYRRGESPAESLPDLADIFPDDPQIRAEIGLQIEPGAAGAQILVQACGACHNDVLDQSISRARFSIDLSRMSRSELGVAIDRVKKPSTEPGAMPPAGRRKLDAEGLERLLRYLESDERPTVDDVFLAHAAEAGMGGSTPR